MSIGWQKYGTPNSAAGQYIPAAAPTNDCPIMYEKVSLEKMKHKLATMLSIDEVTIGNWIPPVLFKYLPVKSLVTVPIIADIVKPKPISVADKPMLLKISDVK